MLPDHMPTTSPIAKCILRTCEPWLNRLGSDTSGLLFAMISKLLSNGFVMLGCYWKKAPVVKVNVRVNGTRLASPEIVTV